MNDNGQFVVTYTVRVPVPSADKNLMARQFSLDADPNDGLLRTIKVAGNPNVDEESASIASTPSGKFAIAFLKDKSTVSGHNIIVKKYNRNGVLKGKYKVGGTQEATVPSIAVDTAGNIMVAWSRRTSGGNGTMVVVARRINRLGVLSALRLVAASGLTDETRPSVALEDGTGNFVVVYNVEDTAEVKEFTKKGFVLFERNLGVNRQNPSVSTGGTNIYYLVYDFIDKEILIRVGNIGEEP